jgi:hypothetical protein
VALDELLDGDRLDGLFAEPVERRVEFGPAVHPHGVQGAHPRARLQDEWIAVPSPRLRAIGSLAASRPHPDTPTRPNPPNLEDDVVLDPVPLVL